MYDHKVYNYKEKKMILFIIEFILVILNLVIYFGVIVKTLRKHFSEDSIFDYNGFAYFKTIQKYNDYCLKANKKPIASYIIYMILTSFLFVFLIMFVYIR